MVKEQELMGLIRHKKGEEYVEMTIFIIAFVVCIISVGIMIYNVVAAFNDDSQRSCDKYIKIQKITSSMALGGVILGVGLFIYVYFKAVGKFGDIRALFTEEELPLW